MKVLVTGASGFVGRILSETLSGRGHEVWGIGRNEFEAATVALRRYHNGNLASDENLEPFIEEAQPEVVVHLAGQASVAASWVNTLDTIQSSVVASVNLFLAVQRTGTPLRTFVDIGSAEEYAPSTEVLTEESPVGPSNPYGMGKVAQAEVLRLLCAEAEIPFIHFRPFNHIGPGQQVGFAIANWASQIVRARGKTLTISVGNLQATRDFTDVRDIVRAYVLAAEGNVPPGYYNLSSAHGRSLHSVLQDLADVAGVEARTVIDRERLRPNDTPVRIGSNERICRLSGWQPAIPWHTTLMDILDSFK